MGLVYGVGHRRYRSIRATQYYLHWRNTWYNAELLRSIWYNTNHTLDSWVSSSRQRDPRQTILLRAIKPYPSLFSQ